MKEIKKRSFCYQRRSYEYTPWFRVLEVAKNEQPNRQCIIQKAGNGMNLFPYWSITSSNNFIVNDF